MFFTTTYPKLPKYPELFSDIEMYQTISIHIMNNFNFIPDGGARVQKNANNKTN